MDVICRRSKVINPASVPSSPTLQKPVTCSICESSLESLVGSSFAHYIGKIKDDVYLVIFQLNRPHRYIFGHSSRQDLGKLGDKSDSLHMIYYRMSNSRTIGGDVSECRMFALRGTDHQSSIGFLL